MITIFVINIATSKTEPNALFAVRFNFPNNAWMIASLKELFQALMNAKRGMINYFCKVRRKKCCIIYLILLALMLSLHFYFIPSWTGTYNDECYLTNSQKKDLSYLINGVVAACQKYNITYWLDYGTLLGAVKFKGLIPWDGDGDISIIYPGEMYNAGPWINYLDARGIDANMMVATYKDMTVDVMRWKMYTKTIKGVAVTYLYKYYPSWSQDSVIVKISHELESFPLSWIIPRLQIKFNGKSVHIPNNWKQLLRKRYPISLGFNLPYKWKCWIPRWTRRNG